MKDLIIVESPTKARTLSAFLGKKYQIEASFGHLRDLPKSELGVDVEKDFTPRYVIPTVKRKQVTLIKKSVQNAKSIILATDPDREGEAIAWHILELLSNSKKGKGTLSYSRIAFHEITPEAVKEALDNPRKLDMNLVDAQQARRVLDRLVGYNLSPLLWHKIKRGLSAGRVQSVAVRLIVERERVITAFVPQEYWTIVANLETSTKAAFSAQLALYQGKKIQIKSQDQAKKITSEATGLLYKVADVVKKAVKRYPQPPFTTSTLQQIAASRLGYSARKTMQLAQNLYEQGLITYMRTDSVNLSDSAIREARNFIEQSFGAEYLPKEAKHYRTRSKVAQEAHEAIRLTSIMIRDEGLKMKADLTRDHVKLYDLIWKRMVACQMKEALLDQTSVSVEAGDYIFKATGSQIKFDGWMRVYGGQEQSADDEEQNGEESDSKLLPELEKGKELNLLSLDPGQHFTEPPGRFSEGTLVKALEEKGIGRPSTYAPIIATIQDRGYVEKENKRLVPTSLAFTVNDFLVEHFAGVMDLSFTAEMEDELDEIARGERAWQPMIGEFYKPLSAQIAQVDQEAAKIELAQEIVDETCPNCGKPLMVRRGRFGKFLACSGFPACKFTKSFSGKTDIKCPDCGLEVVIKRTKRGKTFYGCSGYPACKFASWNKPEVNDQIPSIKNQTSTKHQEPNNDK